MDVRIDRHRLSGNFRDTCFHGEFLGSRKADCKEFSCVYELYMLGVMLHDS